MSAISDYLAKSFGEDAEAPFPGSWRHDLWVLEAFNYCADAKLVADHFGAKEKDLKGLLSEGWEKRLSELRVRYLKDRKFMVLTVVMEKVATDKNRPERHATAIARLSPVDFEKTRYQKPEESDGVDRDDLDEVMEAAELAESSDGQKK